MNNKGETFIETLVSMMILSFVILGFTEVIDSTIKLNKQIKSLRIAYSALRNDKDTDNTWQFKIAGGEGDTTFTGTYSAPDGHEINVYKDGDYYFYEYE